MSQAAIYRYFVPHHPNVFRDWGAMTPGPLWLRHWIHRYTYLYIILYVYIVFLPFSHVSLVHGELILYLHFSRLT